MLVLTRKTDEQILIGDNIKITIVRVRGNSVRIGIDAPREMRVVRGELEVFDSKKDEAESPVLSDREQVFAHPQAKIISGRVKVDDSQPGKPRASAAHTIDRLTGPAGYVGRVRRGDGEKSSRAPLADFVSAT